MALFNKFFQSSKRKSNSHGESAKRQQFSQQHQTSHESIFPFSDEQVRVLIFRECDWSGRRLLFDSNDVQKMNTCSNSPPTDTPNTQNGKRTNSTNKTGTNSSQTFIEICNGYGYVYDHTLNESNSIGEMIFGSAAMSFKGTSLKVHWLREPTRILCSQIFLSPIYPKSNYCRGTSTNDMKATDSVNSDTNRTTDQNSTNSLSLCINDKLIDFDEKKQNVTTNPLDVPSSFDRSNYEFSGCDSGYSGNDIWNISSSSYGVPSDGSSVMSMFSTDPSLNNSRKLSVDSAIIVDAAINGRSSDAYLQRRILRNMSTSFENNLSGNDFIGYFDESKSNINRSAASIPGSMVRRHSDQCESQSNPEMVRRRRNGGKESLKPPHIHFSSYTPRPKNSQRRSKIGLAVCIRFSECVEEEMQLFCSEHIALLESMLCRLRAAAENAYLNQKKFLQLMLKAWLDTKSWITDLFTAPRIQEPVWFSLSNGYSDRPNNLAKHFMTELCWLLNTADTKDTNFFVSTLLTAILTNHLGWVATVAPITNSSSNNDQVITIHQNQAKMSEISKFHPYNVLWAQLGDLYGSIGNPSRLAKTIVCGAHAVTINKVLSVLTYFVRCGEIQRVKTKKVLNKNEIEKMISTKDQPKKVPVFDSVVNPIEANGLQSKITSTCKTSSRDLTAVNTGVPAISMMSNYTSYKLSSKTSSIEPSKPEIITNQMTEVSKLNNENIKTCSTNNLIKLMVTDPADDRFEYETASEAIDFILDRNEMTTNEVANTKQNHQLTEKIKCDDLNESKSRRLLWSIDTIKEGISIEKWKPITIDETDNAQNKNVELKRSHSLKTKSNITNSLRRSKTFREFKSNNILNGNSEVSHDYVNVSHIKSNNNNKIESLATLIQEINFKENVSTTNDNVPASDPAGNVVFVLGDNEVLSGLKTQPPTLPCYEKNDCRPNGKVSSASASPSASIQQEHKCDLISNQSSNCSNNVNHTIDVTKPTSTLNANTKQQDQKKKKHCTHKKHSGVKFNFEQYPQIVTNYMKNKNLDITSYDFLEKGLKLEQENAFNYGASSTSFLPMLAHPEHIHEQDESQQEEEQCECCANTFRILQTPSNATELEFSNDDAVYPVPPTTKTISKKLGTVIENESTSNDCDMQPDTRRQSRIEAEAMRLDKPTDIENENGKTESKRENGNASKRNNNSNCIELITLPIPKTEVIDDNESSCRIRPGYVPSLFVGITDHFISDMVLQGITEPPHKWEPILKQNLTLASHCATFENLPTENVAIIANIDEWDVKLVSSQTYALSSNGLTGPIGMSQLVSTMLETVHAVWLAGTPAYQCMSFLESKLKEIYLQSEALAAFLLATEFCSLNTVTTALNLSANDVPLLLSVASIHSPQVTKKYGISFR